MTVFLRQLLKKLNFREKNFGVPPLEGSDCQNMLTLLISHQDRYVYSKKIAENGV